MYNSTTIKIFAILCIIVSLFGLLLQIASNELGLFGFEVLKWLLCLYSGYLGFRLSSYKLYDDEIKKVTLRLALSPVIAISLLLIMGMVGLVIAVVYAGYLYSIKSNYDSWEDTV